MACLALTAQVWLPKGPGPKVTGLGRSPCARFPDRSQERAYRPADHYEAPDRQLTPSDLVPSQR